MNWYKADLHIHSVLSPCCDLEMSASKVMKTAKEKGLKIIAITDHNSMANCAVYEKAAHELGIVFFWGTEIQTIEEIHIIALFEDKESALSFDEELYESLLPVKNNPDFFGDQVVIDEKENIVRFEDKALINSSRWSLEELVEKLSKINSFYYPAHVDSHAYSIIGQLGFIPAELVFTALEITAGCNEQEFLKEHPSLLSYSLIKSSDAHYLKDIGSGITKFFVKEPTLKEVRLACQKNGRRKHVVG